LGQGGSKNLRHRDEAYRFKKDAKPTSRGAGGVPAEDRGGAVKRGKGQTGMWPSTGGREGFTNKQGSLARGIGGGGLKATS